MKSFVRPFLSCLLVLSLVSLNGCIAGFDYTRGSTGHAATVIWGLDEDHNKIDNYSLSASGAVTPTVILSAPSGTASYGVSAVATDSTGQVYMGYYNGTDKCIAVFAAGAITGASPTRIITTSIGGNSYDTDSLYVDAQGLIYATFNSTVVVYAANATGTATPLRTISGNQTGLSYSGDITADASGNIYVVAYNVPSPILIFSSTATGNVPPTRTITAPTGTTYFQSVAVDASGDVFASEDTHSVGPGYIVEFAPGASGAATPTRTINIATSYNLEGLRLDAAGNIYVMVTLNASPYTAYFLGFGPSAAGLSTPFVTLSSSTIYYDDFAEIAVY
jgi:hypothetical protein